MKKKKEAIIGSILFPFIWMIIGFLLYHAGVVVIGDEFRSNGWRVMCVFSSLVITVFSYVTYFTED